MHIALRMFSNQGNKAGSRKQDIIVGYRSGWTRRRHTRLMQRATAAGRLRSGGRDRRSVQNGGPELSLSVRRSRRRLPGDGRHLGRGVSECNLELGGGGGGGGGSGGQMVSIAGYQGTTRVAASNFQSIDVSTDDWFVCYVICRYHVIHGSIAFSIYVVTFNFCFHNVICSFILHRLS